MGARSSWSEAKLGPARRFGNRAQARPALAVPEAAAAGDPETPPRCHAAVAWRADGPALG
jgi:hypothetical protein